VAFAASNNTVLISDGGLATELEARGHDLSDDLWSARLLHDAPDEIVAAHEIARQVTDKPVIVYPNSGEEWDGRRRTWIGEAGWSADLPAQWVAAGARIVGGCCRVMPDDIAE
jgi:S-methylmethionine-dependent homocysteine/selenocysteine methylase